MTFIKRCFQSENLRAVNFTSSLTFVHLAKKYGTLRFRDSIQQCLGVMTLLGGYCKQYRWLLRPILSHLNTKHVIMPYWLFFWLIMYIFFGECSNSALLSERSANLIMKSEEHWKSDETLFQSDYGHRESVNLRVREMHITYCFCDFLFYGYPYMTKENVML